MLLGKYINKYYLKYGIYFLIGIIALVAVDLFQTYIPDFLEEVVNYFNEGREFITTDVIKRVTSMCGWVVLIGAGLLIGRVTWRITIFKASKSIEADLRHQMFLKAERLSQRYYHENKVGTVTAWFTNDLETIEEYFGWGTIRLVDSFFLSIIVIIKMIQLDWVLAIIAFIPIVLIIVWGALVEKHMDIRWELRQKAYDRLYDFSQETFTGIRVIKAFVKETQELHAFAKVARNNQEVNVNFARMSMAFDCAIGIIIALVLSCILGFGGWFAYASFYDQPVVIFGHQIFLDPGKLTKFIALFDLLIWPMMALGQIVTMHSRAKTSLGRITHYLDEPEEIHESNGKVCLYECKGDIKFKNFTFTYPGSEKPALKNINIHIKPGEIIGVVGKIGCGKTTLVDSLLRLYNYERNSIIIDGNDIMDLTVESVRKHIAYVPQDNFLFSDTIKNNICFANIDEDLEKTSEAAKFANVHDDIQKFTDKYHTVSGERGVTLSGGQKQRISIARAYIKDAPILIMDDSVSAVDVKTEESILENIRTQRKGKTTILVASRVSTVSTLDKIIVINNGEIEAFDTPKNLYKISPTYQRMVDLQKLEAELKGGN